MKSTKVTPSDTPNIFSFPMKMPEAITNDISTSVDASEVLPGHRISQLKKSIAKLTSIIKNVNSGAKVRKFPEIPTLEAIFCHYLMTTLSTTVPRRRI